ncbi:MAG: acetyltransferase [Rhodospirillaceae bacterium]|nr:acetyltransferase [Rhodospirillaceae bacterium]
MSVSVNDRDIILVGASGHARVLVHLLQSAGTPPAALTDIDETLHGTDLYGVPVIGGDDAIVAHQPSDVVLVNAIGNSPGSGQSGLNVRRAVFEKFKERGFDFLGVVSDDASVSKRSTLGEGVQAVTRSIIHPGVNIGDNTILNTGASLDHDCWVGAHSHIAPWAVLCGGVAVGDDCHIGARAVLVPGIRVGDGSIVGAGAVVISDVEAGKTVVGNPARVVGVNEKIDKETPT